MPVQQGKSSLAKMLGGQLVSAQNAHKNDEIKPDTGGSLPAGIQNGIAQLAEVKIGLMETGKHKGKPAFYAHAILVEPEVHDNIPCKGLRTRIFPIPLCDTPEAKTYKTFSDNWGRMLQVLGRLGVNPDSLTGKTAEEIDAKLQAVIERLNKVKPCFRVRTWKGQGTSIHQVNGRFQVIQGAKVLGSFPNEQSAKAAFPFAGQQAMVNEVWGDLVDYQVNGEAQIASSNNDQSGEVAEDDIPFKGQTPAGSEETPDQESGETGGDVDYRALAEQAVAGDSDAGDELGAFAVENGIKQEDVENAKSWTQVADMLDELFGQASGVTEEAPTEEEAPAEEPWKPVKGEQYKYKVPETDPKKKGKFKEVKVEIVVVNGAQETATLKRLDNKALIKGVKWDKIIRE